MPDEKIEWEFWTIEYDKYKGGYIARRTVKMINQRAGFKTMRDTIENTKLGQLVDQLRSRFPGGIFLPPTNEDRKDIKGTFLP